MRKLRKIAPLVLTLHNTTLFHGSPTSRLQGFGFRSVFRYFDAIIVHTEFSKNKILERGWCPADKIHVVPHGVLECYREPAIGEANSGQTIATGKDRDSGEQTVLFFGHVRPYKGVDLLIQAFAQLPPAVLASTRLVIAGKPGIDILELRELAQTLNVDHRITWELRFIPDGEIAEFFNQASLVVLPYRDIDQSGVLMTAIGFETPIVATRIGGIPEVIQDGVHGRLVEPGDVNGLASAIGDVLLSPGGQAKMKRALGLLRKGPLAWESCAHQTLDVYRQVIGARAVNDSDLVISSEGGIPSRLGSDAVPRNTQCRCDLTACMPEVKNKFSVIVPVLNSMDHLRVFMDSILVAMDQYADAELIVFDNGSDDGSYELLLKEYSDRARVQQMRGVTVAGLRNRGCALADGEFLSFIDSDCIMDPNYFEQALRVLRSGADATGSKHELPEAPHWIEKTWHEMHMRPSDGPINYINSGNFVVRRQAFLAVDGFDESLIGTEDVELCLRLSHAGFNIYQSHNVRAVHLGADKSLVAFFRKTAWRGLGVFGLLKNNWLTMPLITTLAHLVLIVAAIASLLFLPAPWFARLLVFLVLFNFAPVATVLYRACQIGRSGFPLKGVLLYHVYFLARFYGICKLVFALDTSSPRATTK